MMKKAALRCIAAGTFPAAGQPQESAEKAGPGALHGTPAYDTKRALVGGVPRPPHGRGIATSRRSAEEGLRAGRAGRGEHEDFEASERGGWKDGIGRAWGSEQECQDRENTVGGVAE